jgi:hypothetical protein
MLLNDDGYILMLIVFVAVLVASDSSLRLLVESFKTFIWRPFRRHLESGDGTPPCPH